MRYLLFILSLLFTNIVTADVLLGKSVTTTSPRIYGATNSGYYTDGTNLLEAIGGTNITLTSALGFTSNGFLTTLGGTCTTSSTGFCHAFSSNNGYLNLPTGGTFNIQVNASNIATLSSTGLSTTGYNNVLGGTCTAGLSGLCTGFTSGSASIAVPSATSINFKSNGTTIANLDQYGHAIRPLSGIPTLGTCGTSSLNANSVDNSIILTISSGTPSSCTINFAHSVPTGTACVVTPAASGSAAITYVTTTTSAVVLNGTSLVGTYNIICL